MSPEFKFHMALSDTGTDPGFDGGGGGVLCGPTRIAKSLTAGVQGPLKAIEVDEIAMLSRSI